MHSAQAGILEAVPQVVFIEQVLAGALPLEQVIDAPPSAHVQRTAQESFEPEPFVLRGFMPWAVAARAGLVFVAFGKSFDAFEAQLRRTVGLDDGVTDALFRFSKPLNTAHFWCPPMRGGRLDLCLLGL